MLKVDGHSVQMTRGDSVRLRITLEGREMQSGAKALFTVKRGPWDESDPVIEKVLDVVDGVVEILLEPLDTHIEPGAYVWDVRIRDGEDVLTPMEYAAWHVLEAIGQ